MDQQKREELARALSGLDEAFFCVEEGGKCFDARAQEVLHTGIAACGQLLTAIESPASPDDHELKMILNHEGINPAVLSEIAARAARLLRVGGYPPTRDELTKWGSMFCNLALAISRDHPRMIRTPSSP
jgi:hypothetical protein